MKNLVIEFIYLTITIQPPRREGTKEKINMNSTMDKLSGFLINFNMPFIKK